MSSRGRILRRIDPRVSHFHLRVRSSPIHRFGVFTLQAIPARRKVIEYTGQRIKRGQALEQLRKSWTPGRPKPIYFFRLNRELTIDGAVGGNGAELINHCCDPNLSIRRVRGHIFFFSRREIQAGEELTLDYRFPSNAEKIPCRCGSAKCRGLINRK